MLSMVVEKLKGARLAGALGPGSDRVLDPLDVATISLFTILSLF